MKSFWTSLVLLVLMVCGGFQSRSESIRAFSLREANRLAERGVKNQELSKLGGITRFAGMVLDQDSGDLILVGRARSDLPTVSIDDLVVALRARVHHKAYPFVSIDPVPSTEKTRLQKVRFGGAVEDTAFGKDLFECDVVLKRYSLDLIKKSEKVASFLKRFELNHRERTEPELDVVEWLGEEESSKEASRHAGRLCEASPTSQSRFWFYVRDDESFIVQMDDVFLIEELKIGVRAEKTDFEKRELGDSQEKHGGGIDENFADEFSKHLNAIEQVHPVLKRLKALFDLVCIAEGIDSLGGKRPNIDFLLDKFSPKREKTRENYELTERVGKGVKDGEVVSLIRLSGGVDLGDILLALEEGDSSALKFAVLESRPNKNSLSWDLPIEAWSMPNENDVQRENLFEIESGGDSEGKEIGFALAVDSVVFTNDGNGKVFQGFPKIGAAQELNVRDPRIVRYNSYGGLAGLAFSRPEISKLNEYASDRRLGGVWLGRNASPAKGSRVAGSYGEAGFSLVIDGKAAQLPPQKYSRFVTALWSVYGSREGPGISIDPIEFGNPKQAVRYIGNVVNTDLGRVMREADYLLKQWAVGVARPAQADFRSPDEIAGDEDLPFWETSSRFWFVPEEMSFRESDEHILFDKGEMAVRTKFTGGEIAGLSADPANMEFASWISNNFQELRGDYRVLNELDEYSKLVQFARYLEHTGFPLLWFLMSNRSGILTEKSSGTVDALNTESDTYKNVIIEGGVDLGADVQFVADQNFRAAVSAAASRANLDDLFGNPIISKTHVIPESFDVGKSSYTIRPMASSQEFPKAVASGGRSETDLCVRHAGFLLTEARFRRLEDRLKRSEMARIWSQNRERYSVDKMTEIDRQLLYGKLSEQSKIVAINVVEKLARLKGVLFDEVEEFSRTVRENLGEYHTDVLEKEIRDVARYQSRLELVRVSGGLANEAGEFGSGFKLFKPYRLVDYNGAGYMNVEKIVLEESLSKNRVTFLKSNRQLSNYDFLPSEKDIGLVIGLKIDSEGLLNVIDRLGAYYRFDREGRFTLLRFSEDQYFEVAYADHSIEELSGPEFVLTAPSNVEYEEIGGDAYPKRMLLVRGGDFNDSVGLSLRREELRPVYFPDDSSDQRFERLEESSQGEFMLHLHGGSLMVFSSNGVFKRYEAEDRTETPASLRNRLARLEFRYLLDDQGHLKVHLAKLFEKDGNPVLDLNYSYGTRGQLIDVKSRMISHK